MEKYTQGQAVSSQNCQHALLWGATHGYVNIIKKAIEMGANVRHNCNQALTYAYGFLTTKFLIDAGAEVEITGIINAVSIGNLKILKLLVYNYTGHISPSIMYIAVSNGDLHIIKFLISIGIPISNELFYNASRFNYQHIVHYFITHQGFSVSDLSPFGKYMYDMYKNTMTKKIYFWWVQICYDPNHLCGQRSMIKKYNEYKNIK